MMTLLPPAPPVLSPVIECAGDGSDDEDAKVERLYQQLRHSIHLREGWVAYERTQQQQQQQQQQHGGVSRSRPGGAAAGSSSAAVPLLPNGALPLPRTQQVTPRTDAGAAVRRQAALMRGGRRGGGSGIPRQPRAPARTMVAGAPENETRRQNEQKHGERLRRKMQRQ
jgi:hypothetical protein